MREPKRVMIVHPGPQFSVHDVYIGWMEALIERGIRTEQYNLEDRIAFYGNAYCLTGKYDKHGVPQFQKAFKESEQVVRTAANGIFSTAFQFWPDLVIIVSAFFIPVEFMDILRSRGMKVALILTESPYEENRQIDRSIHADLACLNDPTRLDDYARREIPAIYMPHAYRPKLHYPGPGEDELETDFAFIGSMFESRQEFFTKMIKTGAFEGIDVTLGGNWHFVPDDSPLLPYASHPKGTCIDNALAVRVYKSAKVGINMYRGEGDDDTTDGWACGPREIEMAACGLFFLRQSRPESDLLFNGILPTYESPEEAADLLRYWLAHDEERQERARAAREAIRDRTFASNVVRLLSALDRLEG